LSGLVVAVPLLLFGLMLSSTQPIPAAAAGRTMLEGNSILYLLLKFVVFGKFLPEPASFNGVPQALYWLRYFFTGRPFPLGATDVFLHPVAWAGWAGLLVTSLNLIPAGQLDGGHVIYVLLGREKAQRLFPFILVGLGLLGFVWGGWWLWALLIFMLGWRFAEPLDQITELDQPRRTIALIGFVLFFLTFIPVPLILF
jgi:membrane-associated protease RseP (regulator of RpoE activity)